MPPAPGLRHARGRGRGSFTDHHPLLLLACLATTEYVEFECDRILPDGKETRKERLRRTCHGPMAFGLLVLGQNPGPRQPFWLTGFGCDGRMDQGDRLVR